MVRLLRHADRLDEEIAADAADLEGDRRTKSRSVAVLWGRRKALALSAGVFLLVLLVSAVPFILRWPPWFYFIPIGLFDAVLVLSTFRLLDPEPGTTCAISSGSA